MSAATHLVLVPSSSGGESDTGLSAVELYELHQRGAGRSEKTICETLGTLARLERYSGRSVESLRPLDVSRFLGQPHLKQNSRAAYYGQISAFYRWWGDNGGSDITAKLPRPKPAAAVPRPITDAQLEQLLNTHMWHRTRGMVLLAAYQGLRAHEIAKMHGRDVDIDAGTLVVLGKGGRTDVLPLHPKVAEYAATMPKNGWWFEGQRANVGKPVGRRAVTQTLSTLMIRAGIPNGTCHRLRHWFGTALVDQDTDLRTVQSLMRHSNLNTTARYTALNDQRRIDAMQRLGAPLTEGEP